MILSEFSFLTCQDYGKVVPLLDNPRWHQIREWMATLEKHSRAGNSAVLDAEVPHDLCVSALAVSSWRFYLDGDSLYTIYPNMKSVPPGTEQLSALDAYSRFGAALLIEAIDKTSVELPWKSGPTQ